MEPGIKLNIGLFGYGAVGRGLHSMLAAAPSQNIRIKKICIEKAAKRRSAPRDLFTTSREDLIGDPGINCIVEAISNPKAAGDIVTAALLAGKPVITANKAMIAANLHALVELQVFSGQPLLYEAAACPGLPLICNLEGFHDTDQFRSMRGVVNGATNFILGRMFDERLDFDTAVSLATRLALAEPDIRPDLSGLCAARKWHLLLLHAFGISDSFEKILYNGIQQIHPGDFIACRLRQREIRLMAQASRLTNGKIAAFVLPRFIEAADPFLHVRQEFSGLETEGLGGDRHFTYGRGTLAHAAAAAVLGDIMALRRGVRYDYRKYRNPVHPKLSSNFYLKVYLSFTDITKIPVSEFTCVEEIMTFEGRSSMVAIIHFNVLLFDSWWRKNAVSLICLPDPVIEENEIEQYKKRGIEMTRLFT